MYNILLEVAKDDIERVFEYTLQKNTETVWNQCRIFTLTKEPKKIYCVQISDITKTKNAEENLRQMLIQEKELTLLKSRFITLTSHEFRTPLTTISSSNELISMQLEKSKIPISDKLKKYTDIIQSEVIHMSDLLNSLLKLGKIDSNKFVINLSDLNMEEAVAAIMEKLLLTQKIPRKIETIIKGKPYNIKMDVKILEMIIENITSNAFKYSQDRPDPILEIDFQESKLVLILQDFGIGIPVLDQPKLFEQFFRASNVGKIKGVGLGLVIVKNMVELLQGNLKIESEEGKGTRIKIDFKNNI
jgi:signal transduction histidine kinase